MKDDRREGDNENEHGPASLSDLEEVRERVEELGQLKEVSPAEEAGDFVAAETEEDKREKSVEGCVR